MALEKISGWDGSPITVKIKKNLAAKITAAIEADFLGSLPTVTLKKRPGSEPPEGDDYKTRYLVHHKSKGGVNDTWVAVVHRVLPRKGAASYWQNDQGIEIADSEVIWWIPLDEVLKELE